MYLFIDGIDLKIILLIGILILAIGYLFMINVIYFLAPTKKWTEFPEKCSVKTKCTRVADANNRGYGLKPIEFEGKVDMIQQNIVNLIKSKPRMEIVNNLSGFIHAIDVTPIFRFYDDVAIKIFEKEGKTTVWMQSQSRLGYYDLQVNEKRIQELHKEISNL